jgi:hypothetical protein
MATRTAQRPGHDRCVQPYSDMAHSKRCPHTSCLGSARALSMMGTTKLQGCRLMSHLKVFTEEARGLTSHSCSGKHRGSADGEEKPMGIEYSSTTVHAYYTWKNVTFILPGETSATGKNQPRAGADSGTVSEARIERAERKSQPC